MRISDWSSDVCSSDLIDEHLERPPPAVLDDVVECDVDGVIALRPLDLIGTAWQRFGTLHRQRGFPLLRRARWGGDGEDGTGDPVGPVCRAAFAAAVRSAEHTSELQSLMGHSYAVFCLEKKNMS